MIHAIFAGMLLIQAAPATPPPAAPPEPQTPVQDIRFCIAATETAVTMLRAEGGDAAAQAAFLEGTMTSLQRERAQLGDADDAALEAERMRIRAAIEAARGGAVEGERERFATICMPRLRAAFGGGR